MYLRQVPGWHAVICNQVTLIWKEINSTNRNYNLCSLVFIHNGNTWWRDFSFRHTIVETIFINRNKIIKSLILCLSCVKGIAYFLENCMYYTVVCVLYEDSTSFCFSETGFPNIENAVKMYWWHHQNCSHTQYEWIPKLL